MIDLQSLTPEVLRARRTLKWSTYPDDVLPLWVAEMDFPTAPPVLAALRRAVARETFGYPLDAAASGLGEAVAAYQQQAYGWVVDPRHVHLMPDVMRGVGLAIETFSGPGDPVVITTPVYMPFFDVVALTGRPQVHVPMVERDGRAALDLTAIDAALADGARILLLCNPYNPLGRVLERAELLALSEVVARHGARVVSDEIHAPLVLDGTHVPYASVSPASATHTATVTSASKAWNLPGLKCAQVVLGGAQDDAVWRRIPLWATVGVSSLGIEASLAAYREGAEWRAAVVEQLRANSALVADAVAGMPGVEYRPNEGTYLAWLDCTGRGLDVEPAAFLLERARVALNPGPPFGAPRNRYARLNFATTTAILEQALGRIAGALG